MDFNKKQRTILIVGIVVMILMGLFPPWTATYNYKSQHSQHPRGYAFIATPPHFTLYPIGSSGIVLDISRLSLQWIVVLLATGLGVFLSGRSNRNN